MIAYNLLSSGLIHAPGMVHNARVMWETGDEKLAIVTMASWDIPVRVAMDILNGDQKYRVEEDKVIVEVPEEDDALGAPCGDEAGHPVGASEGGEGGATQDPAGISQDECGAPPNPQGAS